MDPSKPQKQFKTGRCILFLDKIKCDSLVTLLSGDYETLGKSAQTVAGGLIGCATSLLIWDKIWWNILLSMVTIFYSHQLSDVCSRFTYSRYKVTTVEWEKNYSTGVTATLHRYLLHHAYVTQLDSIFVKRERCIIRILWGEKKVKERYGCCRQYISPQTDIKWRKPTKKRRPEWKIILPSFKNKVH